jgi:hypothetical protein
VLLGLFGLLIFGITGLSSGISEQVEYNATYIVELGSSGDECDPSRVAFNGGDGAVLACSFKGIHPLGPVEADFPGFTKEQDNAVMEVAQQLGRDGLSPDDLSRIQHRVDQISETLPPDRRPNYHEGMRIGSLWGASLAWTGAGALLAVLIIFVGLVIWGVIERKLRRRRAAG